MSEQDDFVAKLDACKRISADGGEYWMARDVQPLLGYASWDKFEPVIERASNACQSAKVDPKHQFSRTGNMVTVGSGAQVSRADWFLSRYACYLIAMNGDTTKAEVGFAQTYFAVQTRLQETQNELTDVERRAMLRERVRDANKSLMRAAKRANVQKYAVFQDAGYKALYGGLGVPDIKRRKGIADADDFLDCAGRAELAANEFRITQTEQKIERDRTKTEAAAIHAHAEVGRTVRRAIRKNQNVMPEDMTAEPNIKKLVTPRRRRELAAAALNQIEE